MKLSFDFYEFVGILIPGSVLLVLSSILFDLKEYAPFFTPEDLGSFGVFIILAYITGHLIQAVGNGIENFYWWFWHGMPTDWPISRPSNNPYPNAVDVVCKLTNQNEPEGNLKEKLAKWHGMIAQARSTIHAEERESRLQVFLGNYGLFRGVLAALVIIAIVGIFSTQFNKWILYPVLTILILLTLYRMDRFAKHYAKEIFANAAELTKPRQENL